MITERPEDIRCPAYRPRWLYALAGGFGVLIALGIAVGGVFELFWGAPILGLLNLPFGAVFAVLGIYLVRRAGTMVVLNREEVRLYRFGRLRLRIPADQLNLYSCGDTSRNRYCLCLSPYTLEKLASFREAEIEKSVLSRNELVFRKRSAKWQSIFAREYILRWTARGLRDPVKKSLIELDCTQEMESVLQRFFPMMPCRQLGTLTPRVFQTFCRQEKERLGGWESDCSAWVLAIVLAAVLLPWLAVFPAIKWGLPPWPVVGGTFLVVLFAGFLLCPKNQVFRPTPEGIRLEGRKPRLIPGENIRTIAKIDIAERYGFSYRLVLTELTVEELARRQTQYLCRSASGRRTMGLYAQIPNGAETLARRYCSRRILWHGGTDQELLVAAYTPEREKLLRELYPHAQWLDWPEGML